jgi:heme-degrading monooxygenase HmoA
MELALIDAIGPFFRGYHKRRVNWSKIPFAHLATAGPEREAQWRAIRADLDVFASKAAGLGYNAVSLDDVAHLSDHPWFEPEIRARNAVFREEFRGLFALLRVHHLRIYLTADFVTTSAAVDGRLGDRADAATSWFSEVAARCLDDFPELEGIILRIGEADGRDVKDPLRSRLVLRTAHEVNRMLRVLLPVFERRERRLIFRTWTAGAYLIGDLIWHRGRFASALRGIQSRCFVVSMKYGESDFFRYLPLNRHFFRIDLPKIIELQARREYEGAGEYPSFIGWDCEHYSRELAGARNVIGFSVWCQTGGWHAFRRLAFLDSEAVWIDLNTTAALRIFKEGASVEQVVASFFGADRAPAAIELLRLTEVVIRELLYIEEFAREKLFFRRVRIPPLLHVYWDSVFINQPVRRVLSHFIHEPEEAIRAGEAAFTHFDRMLELARQIDLPEEDFLFMRDTFAVVLLARRHYLLPPDPALAEEIKIAKKAYKARWPRSVRQRYRIRLDLEPARFNRRTVNWLLGLLVRDELLKAWAADASFLKTQPGYISAQLHRGIGGSCCFMNIAVWESVAHFKQAFMHPTFQAHLNDYPPSTEASPHLFSKVAVPSICVSE